MRPQRKMPGVKQAGVCLILALAVLLNVGFALAGLQEVADYRPGVGKPDTTHEEAVREDHPAGLQMGLSFGGAIGYSIMGDFEADRRGREYFSRTQDWERFIYSAPHLGYGWNAEMRFKASSGYWAAFGIAQLLSSGKFEVVDTLFGQTPEGAYDLEQSVNVSAFPLTLTLGASLPVRSMNLYCGLGVGLYYGLLSVSRAEHYEETGFSWISDLDASMSSANVGFHLTGGAEFFFARGLALYGEGLLRLAKLQDFSGELTYEYSDSNWHSYYLDEKAYAVMNECPGASSEEYMSVESDRPDGDERWMEVDFSGFTLDIGLRFYMPL